MKVYVFTDGSCDVRTGHGGWGALLQWGEHQREMYAPATRTTNNRMELTAVIEALNALTKPCKVEVTTDSQYVQKGYHEWLKAWKRRGWKTAAGKPVENQDLWEALLDAAKPHKIQIVWVRGHAGHDGNERAHTLASRGLQEANAHAEAM